MMYIYSVITTTFSKNSNIVRIRVYQYLILICFISWGGLKNAKTKTICNSLKIGVDMMFWICQKWMMNQILMKQQQQF